MVSKLVRIPIPAAEPSPPKRIVSHSSQSRRLEGGARWRGLKTHERIWQHRSACCGFAGLNAVLEYYFDFNIQEFVKSEERVLGEFLKCRLLIKTMNTNNLCAPH